MAGITDRLTLRTILALVAICALALGLRLLGISYGLPAIYNPDETPILNRALTFAKGDLNPHNFVYPTLYFYLVFAWEGLFFVTARAVGLYDSLAAFQREFFIDPSRHFLAGACVLGPVRDGNGRGAVLVRPSAVRHRDGTRCCGVPRGVTDRRPGCALRQARCSDDDVRGAGACGARPSRRGW